MTAHPQELLRWSTRESSQPLPGITASVALGAQLSAAVFTLAPGAVVPHHEHPNEEFGQVLRGSLELRWADQVHVLTAGEGFILPAGVAHGARALDDGCELLECYAPPRVPTPPPANGEIA